MVNPVVHFEVAGKDPAVLTSFYGQAFDWRLQEVMPGVYWMVSTGGETDVPGGIGVAPDGGDGHVMFYVEVDDPAAALQRINALGGRTVSEPMEVPDGPTIAHFADPEGHVIGLVKSR
jgi:predicted enzyme related to lactoylglutathione lyase